MELEYDATSVWFFFLKKRLFVGAVDGGGQITGLYSAVALGSESRRLGICQVGATFLRVIASDASPGQTTPRGLQR